MSPFHYYDQCMQTGAVTPDQCDAARADCVGAGRPGPLCDRARALCVPERLYDYVDRLLADENFQRDAQLREAALDGLRYHMRHLPLDADVATRLDTRVAEVFGAIKVRLRSSTNAEELAVFCGAGLYNSVSAWAEGTKAASDQVGKAWCWGSDSEGKLGAAGNAGSPVLTDDRESGALVPLTGAVDVSVGADHACARCTGRLARAASETRCCSASHRAIQRSTRREMAGASGQSRSSDERGSSTVDRTRETRADWRRPLDRRQASATIERCCKLFIHHGVLCRLGACGPRCAIIVPDPGLAAVL